MLQVVITLPFDFVLFNALRIFSLPLSLKTHSTRFVNVINAQSLSRKSYRDGIQRTYH